MNTRVASDWYAAIYGTILKAEGYDPDEVLVRVAEMYPHTAHRIEEARRARDRERVEQEKER